MEQEFNANNFLLRLILQYKDGFQVFKIYVLLDLLTLCVSDQRITNE